MPHCSAASIALAREPLDADPGDLRMLRDDRLQHAGAHLHRLLHQIVEPSLLQRREAVDEIGFFGLRPRLLHRFEPHRLLRLGRNPRQPFAVAPVEQEQFRALGHAQHVGQIMALLRARLDGGSGGEVLRHVEPLHLVVCAHRRGMGQGGYGVKSLALSCHTGWYPWLSTAMVVAGVTMHISPDPSL